MLLALFPVLETVQVLGTLLSREAWIHSDDTLWPFRAECERCQSQHASPWGLELTPLLCYGDALHSVEETHALSAAGLWEPWTRRECLWWEGGAVSSEGGHRSAQVDGAVYHLPPPSEGRVLDVPDPFGVGLQRE